MSNVSVARYDDFTGGLNLRADQFQLAKNESPDMLNVEVDPRGGLFTRGGIREITTTDVLSGAWTPHKLVPFYGTSSYLMLTASNKIFKTNSGTFSVLEYSAGNAVVSTQTHGASLAAWGETLYIATGSTSYYWKTTDTYATALGLSGTNPNDWQTVVDPSVHKMPNCKHLLIHANKMFAANTVEDGVAYPNRVRWSLEGIPDNWSKDDYIDFQGGGTGITGMVSVGGQLVVFKPSAVYIVYGYDATDHQVVQLSTLFGAVANDHIAVAENGVYFYSHPQGLYFYNGTTVTDVFENLKSMNPLGYVNLSNTTSINVSYVNRRVWLGLPYSKDTTVSYTNHSFVYDPTINNGSWIDHQTADGYGLIGGTDWTNPSGVNGFYMIHPALPRVVSVDNYNNETDLINGQELHFSSYYRTGWVDAPMYSMKKMWRRPDIVIKQVDTARDLNIKVFHNYEEAIGNERKNFNIHLTASSKGSIWGQNSWGQGTWGEVAQGAQIIRGSNLGLAKSVQLLFTGPQGFWGLDSISYKYNNRKVTG